MARRRQAADTAEIQVEEVEETAAEAPVETPVEASNDLILVGPNRYVCVSLKGGTPIEKGERISVDDDDERERLLTMTYLGKHNYDLPYFIPASEEKAWKARNTVKSRVGGDMSSRGLGRSAR